MKYPQAESSGDVQANSKQQLGWLAAFTVITLGAFVGLSCLIGDGDPLAIDLIVTRFIQSFQSEWLTTFMIGVSWFGWRTGSIVAVSLAVIVISWRIHPRSGGFLLILVVIEAILNRVVKSLISRPRPNPVDVMVVIPESLQSFPSGHVMFYTVIFGFLLFLVMLYAKKRWIQGISLIVLSGFMILVGPSRIYLGAHWLSDVIGAYLLGLAILEWGIFMYNERIHSSVEGVRQSHP